MNSDTYSYVIDTHSLVWYLSDWQKLGKKSQEIFDKIEKGNAIALIPAIVLAEIVFLAEKKRIRSTLENTLSRIESSDNFKIIFMDLAIIKKLVELQEIPEMHDRMIVAVSLVSDAVLVTKDEQISKSGIVKTLWK
jgi:PIN domain nuclease of toxin-antitoxin system